MAAPVFHADFSWPGDHFKLLAMGGNFCVGRRRHALFEFWVMESYGVEDSWKRSVSTFGCRTMPFVLDLPRSKEALVMSEG
ncbi:hypothetical protein V6N13_065051 [Hibiscus sabdariffa]